MAILSEVVGQLGDVRLLPAAVIGAVMLGVAGAGLVWGAALIRCYFAAV